MSESKPPATIVDDDDHFLCNVLAELALIGETAVMIEFREDDRTMHQVVSDFLAKIEGVVECDIGQALRDTVGEDHDRVMLTELSFRRVGTTDLVISIRRDHLNDGFGMVLRESADGDESADLATWRLAAEGLMALLRSESLRGKLSRRRSPLLPFEGDEF